MKDKEWLKPSNGREGKVRVFYVDTVTSLPKRDGFFTVTELRVTRSQVRRGKGYQLESWCVLATMFRVLLWVELKT